MHWDGGVIGVDALDMILGLLGVIITWFSFLLLFPSNTDWVYAIWLALLSHKKRAALCSLPAKSLTGWCPFSDNRTQIGEVGGARNKIHVVTYEGWGGSGENLSDTTRCPQALEQKTGVDSEGVQDSLLQNMAPRHIEYFKLKESE